MSLRRGDARITSRCVHARAKGLSRHARNQSLHTQLREINRVFIVCISFLFNSRRLNRGTTIVVAGGVIKI